MSKALNAAQRIAERFAKIPQVESVALGGSRSKNVEDTLSDIDLYIYSYSLIPLEARLKAAAPYDQADARFNNNFWGLGDDFRDSESGILVDAIYWDCRWIESELYRLLWTHQASVGYTTTVWSTVQNGLLLFDRNGWYARMQTFADLPYPEELRRAIVAQNHPILRDTVSSYVKQIEQALHRDDLMSVQHRITALLASYFDILFAVNRQPHPGEKRLFVYASELCPLLPADFPVGVESVLVATPYDTLLKRIHALLDPLDVLLREEGLI